MPNTKIQPKLWTAKEDWVSKKVECFFSRGSNDDVSSELDQLEAEIEENPTYLQEKKIMLHQDNVLQRELLEHSPCQLDLKKRPPTQLTIIVERKTPSAFWMG